MRDLAMRITSVDIDIVIGNVRLAEEEAVINEHKDVDVVPSWLVDEQLNVGPEIVEKLTDVQEASDKGEAKEHQQGQTRREAQRDARYAGSRAC